MGEVDSAFVHVQVVPAETRTEALLRRIAVALEEIAGQRKGAGVHGGAVKAPCTRPTRAMIEAGVDAVLRVQDADPDAPMGAWVVAAIEAAMAVQG